MALYITFDQAIEIHRRTIEFSGGGTIGVLQGGQLESVLFNIQNDDWYPAFEDKLTHLFFGLCKFHCFSDGNKRLAIVLATQMLLLNGYFYAAKRFIHDMEEISVRVADDKIDKALLRDIIAAYVAGDPDSEELKLRILDAIS